MGTTADHEQIGVGFHYFPEQPIQRLPTPMTFGGYVKTIDIRIVRGHLQRR
jgi:hypothetical protein